VTFASVAKVPFGVDELTIAGALAGTGVEVVRGKTVDLLVPARAECVIEGFVRPGAEKEEGPFGEYLGYVNSAAPAAIVKVTAITRRSSPVHHGFVQQMPPSDGHLVMEMGVLGPLWFHLTRKLGIKSIRDLAIARGSAGLSILVAQIERSHASESAHIGRLIAKCNSGLKFIYLVDEDIDIRDQDTLNWALSSRVNGSQDIEFVKGFDRFKSAVSTLQAREGEARESVAIVNAMLRQEMPEISLPTPRMMLRTLEDWEATNLPPITPRRRLKRLLRNCNLGPADRETP
jgi:UbiD family decarboxylase